MSSSWSLPSFSSLASSLTDLSTKVTSTVSSTASSVGSTASDLLSPLTDSVSHLISDTKRSFDEEQSKVDQRRAQMRSLEQRPPPTSLWSVASESQQILEAELKQRILRLSADPRTFLSPAPDDASFSFSLDVAYPYCEVALREDAGLGRARYRLVPRRVSEHQFWKNYMWRVATVREQMGVGELFETTALQADADRAKLKAERIKKREEDIAREKKMQQQQQLTAASQQKPAVPLPVAAAALPSPPVREEKDSERKASSPSPPPASMRPSSSFSSLSSSSISSSAASSSPTRPRAAGAGAGSTGRERRHSVDGEFISDDYVNVASQDVALVGAMRKELGLQGRGGESSSAAAAEALEDEGDGGEGLEGVTDADLDDLEMMLADIQVNEGDASNDLLEELETMQQQQDLDAKRLP